MTLANAARKALEDKKAADVVLLDVRGLSDVTDFLLMASGTRPPHLKALAGEVQVGLKRRAGVHCYRRAGDPASGWVVLDYVDAVIHILSREARDYYEIESLWEGAPRV